MMKPLTTLIAVLVAGTAMSAQLQIPDRPTREHAGSVSISYDRFKDTTSAVLTGVRIGGALSTLYLGGLIMGPGQDLSRAEQALLVFQQSNREWRYLQCHNVDFLIDGEPIGALRTEHGGNVGTAGISQYSRVNVEERVLVYMSIEQLIRLATAEKIEGRLCQTEFNFNDRQRMAIRGLASRLKP